MEKRRFVRIWFFLFFFILCWPADTMADTREASSLIGKETWNFNLASTSDRLINYGDDYYGKSHLIMTFFPAAFTPV
ncbi:hypothetical protein EG832_01510 [bacterium]|nr:hypothetical protein [bacterium]